MATEEHGLLVAVNVSVERPQEMAGFAVSINGRFWVSTEVTCSMSRRGNCYDNSLMEAFFSTLEGEVGERFPSHADAKAELFDHIEVFYNQRRRHSAAGRMSPAAFERGTTQAA